eukprot:5225596-Karenia_brevis.AAC.1
MSHFSTTLPADVCGQSQTLSADLESSEVFSVYFINIRGFISHRAELTATLEALNYPTLVGLNETLLPGERAL